jgi:hypothetical protein
LTVVAQLDRAIQYSRAIAVDRCASYSRRWQAASVVNQLSEYWVARSSRAMTPVKRREALQPSPKYSTNNNAIFEMASRPDAR